MNKMVLLLLPVLLLPAYAHALDLPFIGGDKKAAEGADQAAQEEKKGKTSFLIHFKTGGELVTDNYTVTDDNIIVMMPAGAIYLDKKMVSSIEEVAGVEEEQVQTIEVAPAETGKAPARNGRRAAPVPRAEEREYEPTDDEGHTEQWWQSQVQRWKDRKAEAEQRYAEAEDQWARADGALQDALASVPVPTIKQVPKLGADGRPVVDENGNAVFEIVEVLEPSVSQYDIIKYQDLRGSARVAMDRAKAEIEEADRMLNEELPDEARKAGAPPGWVR